MRLDAVATFRERLGPAVIGRFDLQYAATFYASPSIPLASAMEKVREAGRALPIGYSVVFIGEAEQLEKTREATAFTFLLALVLLFMVLASQFNSFLQPFFIMLAVPLAIVGGVFALWLFVPLSQLGQSLGVRIPMHTLNIYSMIGLVLLIGLVAKNSILLVDLTNQRRAQGLAVDAALLQRKQGLFTGGFLAPDHLRGPAEVLLFCFGSLLSDAALIGLLSSIALIFVSGSVAGATTVHGMPSFRAHHATPWAILPAEAVTTPRSSFSGGKRAIAFDAPRILNDPIGCRFSSFK